MSVPSWCVLAPPVCQCIKSVTSTQTILRDRVDQHRGEHHGDEVDEDERTGKADDELQQRVEIPASLGAEIEVEEIARRIDDERPELVRARAAGLPVHQVRDVHPDDLA